MITLTLSIVSPLFEFPASPRVRFENERLPRKAYALRKFRLRNRVTADEDVAGGEAGTNDRSVVGNRSTETTVTFFAEVNGNGWIDGILASSTFTRRTEASCRESRRKFDCRDGNRGN